MTIGAYHSKSRACIGLATDSAWHEVVHEMVHLNFEARSRSKNFAGQPLHGSPGVQALEGA